MKNILSSLILLGLALPAVQAKEPTPWDRLATGAPILGSVTVITKDGKKHKDTSVSFNPSSLTLAERRESISREEVKEVVIRQRRDRCCTTFWLPTVPIGLAIYSGDNTLDKVLLSIVVSPLEAASIAATPPAVLIEGIIHLTPSKVLFRIAP
jgi:hypothetical protein